MANSLNKITTKSILDATVATADIAADAVTGAKIADDAIDSEHITDGSIDTAHIAADQITGAKIADDAVGSEHIEVLDAALQFGDSVKAQFGAGNDLEIYHDGSNSYIKDTGTGLLKIESNQLQIKNDAADEKMIVADANGAVELYYDNSKEFQTVANGIELTSNTSASGTEQTIYLSPTTTTDRSRSCSISGLNTDGNNNQALVFKTSAADTPAERMRIDSSGRVLIGATTEGEVSADELTVEGSGNTGITIRSGTTSAGNIFFSDGSAGDNEYRGYVQYKQGEEWMVLGTAANTRLRVDADGLKFGTDTAAANALDDYEEGTWTPTILGSSTAGSYSYEAARTGGKYTKIGNLVYIEGVLRISSISSAGAGSLKFSGLPYAFGSNPAPSWNEGTGIQITHYAAGSNSTVSDYPPPFIAIGPPSGTTFTVYSYGKNYAVDTDIQDLSAANWIYQIAGCYHV